MRYGAVHAKLGLLGVLRAGAMAARDLSYMPLHSRGCTKVRAAAYIVCRHRLVHARGSASSGRLPIPANCSGMSWLHPTECFAQMKSHADAARTLGSAMSPTTQPRVQPTLGFTAPKSRGTQLLPEHGSCTYLTGAHPATSCRRRTNAARSRPAKFVMQRIVSAPRSRKA